MVRASDLPPLPKYAGLVAPIVFIIAGIVLNVAYREPLYYRGVNQIYRMQQNQNGFFNFIQNIFSMFGNTISVVVVLVLYLVLVKNRLKVIVHLIFLTGALYYMTVLKQILEEGRPFWTTSNIQQLEWFCPLSFGNPSGHSCVVFVLYEPMISDVFGCGPKKIWTYVWLFISIMVMISRMYLGAHSLDQIVFGGLLGLAFLVYYKFFLQELLYETVINMLNGKHRKFYAIVTTVIFFVFLSIPIIAYIIESTSRPPVDATYINNIAIGCSGLSVTSQYLLVKNFKGTSLGFFGLGMLYGLLMLKNKHNQDVLYLTGQWNFTSVKSALYTLMIFLFISGFPAGTLAILIPTFLHVPVLVYIFMAIAATWASFAMIYILSIIQNKYRWIAFKNDGQNHS